MNYLYNGREYSALPALTHQYALITEAKYTSSPGLYNMAGYTQTFNEGGSWSVQNIGACDVYRIQDGEWILTTSHTEDAEATPGVSGIVWANFDIYNSDGTLYLAASDPVPILTRSPAAMALGWLAGMAVRRMRGQKVETPEEPEPTLPEKGNDLADYSWAEISEISKAGVAADHFAVGDEKDITLTTGETITFQIIGFNHDVLSDGSGYAGITFQMKNLLATTYNMNSSKTNVGGWTSCAMRTRLQPGGAIYDTLPDDVKAVIRPVEKRTSVGNTSTSRKTTNDYAFLLSEVEIIGTTYSSVTGEGTQYDYYNSYANTADLKVKKLSNGSGSANSWWGRSPCKSDTSTFCGVMSYGSLGRFDSTGSLGVSFAFCV